MWITNAMEAGFFIVFANLDPSKGYKGISAFIVEKGTPGFSIAKKEKKLGIRASSTCVLNFDDVEIPKDQLLGEEGQGYKYAIGLLNEGRIGIAAQMTGLAIGAWENAAGYVFCVGFPDFFCLFFSVFCWPLPSVPRSLLHA
jgi:alkylation response protein AidB-like acyl-CoA dehydrogenase